MKSNGFIRPADLISTPDLPRRSPHMFSRTRLLEVCLLVFTTIPSCFAQSGASSTIAGTVTDSSGASIPNANVTVTNQATNARQDTVASSSGTYSIPSLLPGTYVVSVSGAGFSTQVIKGVELAVAQRVTVDVHLKPGVVTESVIIGASATVLNTENSAVGQVVNEQQIVDLPLNGRNFTQLLLLGAGAVQVNGEQGIYRANEGNALSIQGGRADSNVYMLDGLVINDSYYQTPALIPSIDVLQEFQEQTKGYSAAYGGGANQINLLTKSGTNQLHGTAYDFLRNDALDARNFFDPEIISPLRQNQFGY
ncbi:MAG: carboxypeptidase regulatory-like domain-containing protein, partial [Blastocatellia bacterium]|nr:carboxypeptidase regulatory-like domain-containing protein [Blastocatellia bacterium]